MKTKIISLALGAATVLEFLVAHLVAQSPASAKTRETARVVFDHERSRVIEYHTNSGVNICGLGMHYHPAHLYMMTTGAKLRIVTPDGKEEIIDAKAGEVGWEPAVAHRVENLSGNNAGCYIIEFKDKEWKPSTGLGAEVK
jgi:beta-alanine degradation protein BauB